MDHEKRKSEAFQNITNASNRMDAMVIAISSGGIYASLETTKFIQEQEYFIWPWGPMLSSILFLAAIAVNFYGQHFSIKANHFDYLMSQAQLNLEKAQGDPEKQKKFENQVLSNDFQSEFYSKKVVALNKACGKLTWFGILILLLFYLISIAPLVAGC